MIVKKIIILLLTLAIFETAYSQSGVDFTSSERWHNWRKQWNYQFPVASWAYFSRYSGTIEEYNIYKDAGLTMVQVPLEQYSNAVAAGLKVITGGWQKLYEDQSILDSYIIYPGAEDLSTTMYNLVDEPSPSLFAQLDQSVSRVYQTDKRKALPFITMLPNWAVPYSRFNMSYENFVQQFADQVNPAIMVHTHYPILCNGTDRPEYYQNAELFRKISLDKNIGLMGFVSLVPYQHSTNISMCYREASESDIYWQVYSMIAYGAQGVWYYNYRIGNESQFGEGLVLHATGQPNPSLYPHVQAVNNQLHKLAPILMKLQSVKVAHLHNNGEEVPATTTRYTNGMITGINNISGDNFVVSEFKNQDDAQDVNPYVMLVNKRHAANTASSGLQANVAITVDPTYSYVYQYNPANGNMELLSGSFGQYNIMLEGGHARLLRLSSTPLQTTPQSPSITYSTPKVYQQNNPITPLYPNNNGVSIIPGVIYSKVATIAGNGAAGSDDGLTDAATFTTPGDVVSDENGNLYVADFGNHSIRKITPEGAVTTFAGTPGVFGNTDGVGTSAKFRNPNGIDIDGMGNIYVADRNNHRIRKISISGEVSTLSGSTAGYLDGNIATARFSAPIDVVVDKVNNNVFVLEVNGSRIRKISTDGIVSTIAGSASGTAGYIDGSGTEARFANPYAMALDKSDNIYVADRNNHRIRKIDTAGIVSTIAGNGTAASIDGISTEASFNAPSGIAVAASGEIYISEYNGHRIRKIDTDGQVSTLAGNGGAAISNGIGSMARVRYPFGLSIAPSGNLLLADFGNNAIRRITLAGYNITPNLPVGLKFNVLTGVIEGIPKELSPSTNYTISVFDGDSKLVATTEANISIVNATPVSLISYNARVNKENFIEVIWKTASEKNNNFFEIQLSVNGNEYSSLVKIPSKGYKGNMYAYTDKNRRAGTSYYKLLQHDLNGKVSDLGTASIYSDQSETSTWSVSPNPVTGTGFRIYLQKPLKIDHIIRIYDMRGKLILTKTATPENYIIDIPLVSKPTPGMYIVKVGELGSKKIIIK